MGFNFSSTWKLLLGLAIPIVEAAGQAMEAGNDPKQKLIGEGLVYLGELGQFLHDGANGTPPVVPASLST